MSEKVLVMVDQKKVAVVAGVGAGLGNKVCVQFVEAGYHVVGLSRSNAGSEMLPARLGEDNYLHISCDMTDVAQVDSAISKVEQQFGMVNVYVHNAAYLHIESFAKTQPAEFESLWRIM